MGRRPKQTEFFDTDLADLPPELRWRSWVRGGSCHLDLAQPVTRETLTRQDGRAIELSAHDRLEPALTLPMT
jgi:segregation and condensation protein B